MAGGQLTNTPAEPTPPPPGPISPKTCPQRGPGLLNRTCGEAGKEASRVLDIHNAWSPRKTVEVLEPKLKDGEMVRPGLTAEHPLPG